MNEDKGEKFANFMKLHRTLLDCYAGSGMHPAVYKTLDPATQHDFCYSQRVQIEDQLIKGKIRPQDFFAAVQNTQ